MADIAEIGFEVDTSQLEEANEQLDEMAAQESRIKRAASGIGGAFGNVARSAGRASAEVGKRGLQASLFGVAGAVSTSLVRYAQFEEQLINIQKTTNAADSAVQRIGTNIQNLAGEIPVATTELGRIAAIAGQLGVRGSENINQFTETVGRLTTATDLAGEEAATALARIIGVTDSSIQNVARLSASLVELGNTSKATESEILDVANEVARATAAFDVSARETVALGAALRSLGQRSEIAGSAVGRTLREIQSVVSEGGSALGDLENVIGASRSEIQGLIEAAPIELFRRFAEGLDETATSSQELNAQLEEFGIKGNELLKVIPSLVRNSDLLNEKLNSSKSAFEENAALILESEQAAASLSSEFQLLVNELDTTAQRVGSVLAPVFQTLSEEFRGFLDEAQRSGAIRQFTEESIRAIANFVEAIDDAFGGVDRQVLQAQRAFLQVQKTLEQLGFISNESGNKVEEASEQISQGAEKARDSLDRGLQEGLIPNLTRLGQDAVDAVSNIDFDLSDLFTFGATGSAIESLTTSAIDPITNLGDVSKETRESLKTVNAELAATGEQAGSVSVLDQIAESLRNAADESAGRRVANQIAQIRDEIERAQAPVLAFVDAINSITSATSQTSATSSDFLPDFLTRGTGFDIPGALNVDDLPNAFESAFDEVSKDTEELGRSVEFAFVNAFEAAKGSLQDLIRTGELDFNNLADTIRSELSRIAAESLFSGQGFAGFGELAKGFGAGEAGQSFAKGIGAAAVGTQIGSAFVDGVQSQEDKIGATIAGGIGAALGGPVGGAIAGAGASAILGGEEVVGKKLRVSVNEFGDALAEQVTTIADTGVFSNDTRQKIERASEQAQRQAQTVVDQVSDFLENISRQFEGTDIENPLAGFQGDIGGAEGTRAVLESVRQTFGEDIPQAVQRVANQLSFFARDLPDPGDVVPLSREAREAQDQFVARIEELRDVFGEDIGARKFAEQIKLATDLTQGTLFEVGDGLGQTGQRLQALSNEFEDISRRAELFGLSLGEVSRQFSQAASNIISDSGATVDELRDLAAQIRQTPAQFENEGELLTQIERTIRGTRFETITDVNRLVENAIQGRDRVPDAVRRAGFAEQFRGLSGGRLGAGTLENAVSELTNRFQEGSLAQERFVSISEALSDAFRSGKDAVEQTTVELNKLGRTAAEQREVEIRRSAERAIREAQGDGTLIDEIRANIGGVLSQFSAENVAKVFRNFQNRVQGGSGIGEAAGFAESQIDLLERAGIINLKQLGDAATLLGEKIEDSKDTLQERVQFEEEFRVRLLEAQEKTKEARLAEFDQAAEEEIEQAKELGANVNLVERALSEERQDIIERFKDQAIQQEKELTRERINAIGSAQDFLDIAQDVRQTRQGLLTGSQSALSPGGQFEAARSQFETTLESALGGDEAAFGRLQGRASTLLDTARQQFAAGPRFAQVFERVQNSLRDAEEAALNEANSINEQQLRTLQNSQVVLKDVRAELQRMNQKVDRQTQRLAQRSESGSRS